MEKKAYKQHPEKIGVPFHGWFFTNIPDQPMTLNKISGIPEGDKSIVTD